MRNMSGRTSARVKVKVPFAKPSAGVKVKVPFAKPSTGVKVRVPFAEPADTVNIDIPSADIVKVEVPEFDVTDEDICYDVDDVGEPDCVPDNDRKRHKGRTRCDSCGEVFKAPCLLRHHMIRKHGAESKFQCGICRKYFHAPSDMRRHVMAHLGEKRHNCEHCGKAFVRKDDMRKHTLRLHTPAGDRPRGCDACGRILPSQAALNLHQRETHSGIVYNCGQCDKTYYRKESFKQHWQKYHTGTAKQKPLFDCPECSIGFKTKLGLKNHVGVHKKIKKPFACNACGESFKSITSLKSHFTEERCQNSEYYFLD